MSELLHHSTLQWREPYRFVLLRLHIQFSTAPWLFLAEIIGVPTFSALGFGGMLLITYWIVIGIPSSQVLILASMVTVLILLFLCLHALEPHLAPRRIYLRDDALQVSFLVTRGKRDYSSITAYTILNDIPDSRGILLQFQDGGWHYIGLPAHIANSNLHVVLAAHGVEHVDTIEPAIMQDLFSILQKAA